ncbi:monovalent cation:proton antiporter-2 (CPA2) family protein [Teredinibacter turnerae]|uniref:monovalent cation:proton antiporter-2 (CPA2) family protein n=1 Tax=Teredinibacter turnerae TaxID=2426 RepID=UPI0030CB4C32
MDHHGILVFLAYLLAAMVAVPIFKRLGLGAILGYLVAGTVLGPQILHVVINPDDALHLAEFGIVMLLFVIGLELNPQKLWEMRTQVLLMGGGQLLGSAVVIALLCHFLFNFDWQIALLLGLTLGLSSTAFAVQLMDEQGVMATDLGRKGFSMLLLQDMAVIPILILVSAFAPQIATAGHNTAPWWYGPLAIAAVLLVGRFAINPLLTIIAATNIRELLTAAALFIVIGTAFLMQSVGFSMGLGAFLAGIVLANCSFRHQLETDIEPFKGLLLGLFFMAVGMTLNLQLLVAKPLLIFGLAVGLMLLKTAVITLLCRSRSTDIWDALALGLMLSQGGEFAFVVLTKMVNFGVADNATRDIVVIVVGVSMALTSPALMLFNLWRKRHQDTPRSYDKIDNEEPEVIIAGLGRFGQIAARILAANEMHFSALDKDASHVDFVRKFGNKIYYGDATRLDLLNAAGLAHARLLLVAVDDEKDSLTIVDNVQSAYPNLKIIVRAHNRAHAYQLFARKVDVVVRETFESGLIAARHTLELLGYTESQALNKIEIFRQHDEQMMMNAVAHKEDLTKLQQIAMEGRRELEELFKQDTHH